MKHQSSPIISVKRIGAATATMGAQAKRLFLQTSAGKITRRFVRALRRFSRIDFADSIEGDYQRWLALHHEAKERSFAICAKGPKFIVVLLQDESNRHLEATLESLGAQTYEHWQVCVAGAESNAHAARGDLEQFEKGHPDKVVASQPRAKQGLADSFASPPDTVEGEFVVYVESNALLEPDALAAFARAIHELPDTDVLYCDHDQVSPKRKRERPILKPAWSPELLISSNYVGPLLVVRRELAKQCSLLSDWSGSERYDLLLRLSEYTDRIRHIRGVLYHSRLQRSTKRQIDFDLRALQAHLDRRQIAATARRIGRTSAGVAGMFKLDFQFESPNSVTIVIPTKDRLELLTRCLNSLERLTAYPNYDVVIVDNGSHERATLDYYRRIRHQVISCPLNGRFNFSALVNEGVRSANGEFVLLLNNDTEIIRPDWLHELVGYGRIPGIGAVGAKLLYPDRRIQHAGVILGHEGLTGHYFQGETDATNDTGYLGMKNTVRNVAAVTGACLLTPRALYKSMGGFNEEKLGVAWNDVDYCLRLLTSNLRVVLNPHSVLLHHEGASRGEAKNIDEVHYMMRTWPEYIRRDPFYHSYFSRTGRSFRLRLDPQEDERYFYRRYSRTLHEPNEPARDVTEAPC